MVQKMRIVKGTSTINIPNQKQTKIWRGVCLFRKYEYAKHVYGLYDGGKNGIDV